MIETLRRIVPAVITVSAMNTQIDALNTQYTASVDHLGTNGVLHMWNKTWHDLPKPCVAYLIGYDKDGKTQLQWNGLRRATVPIWFYLLPALSHDFETAFQNLGIMFEALTQLIDAFPPNGLEQQQLAGVSPTRAIALVQAGQMRNFTLEAAGPQIPGLGVRYDCEVYVATS